MRLARLKPPGRSLDPVGNRGARGMIAARGGRKRSSRGQDPAYRPALRALSCICWSGGEARAMKVLVTGGAGFIGSHLAEALVHAGHRVRVLDNLYSGRRSNLGVVRRDVEFVEGDCADPASARR